MSAPALANLTRSIRYDEHDGEHAALIPLVAICLLGGGRFVGIQAAVPECGIEAHAVFLAPSGTSRMLPLSQLTPQAVFQKCLDSVAQADRAAVPSVTALRALTFSEPDLPPYLPPNPERKEDSH